MLNIADNPAVFNNTKLCNSLFYCIGKIGRFFYSVKSTDLTNPFALNGGNFPYLDLTVSIKSPFKSPKKGYL